MTDTIQDANVRALDDLSDPAREILIQGWAVTEIDHTLGNRIPVPTRVSCAHDEDHGKGVCFDPGSAEFLCLACMVDVVEAALVTGYTVEIEVYA